MPRGRVIVIALVAAVALAASFLADAESDAEAAPHRPKFRISGKVVSDRGILYFASTAPYMYAVSAARGEELWRYRPSASIDDVQVENGVVYTIVGDELHAIDIRTRKAKWIFSATKRLGRASVAFDRNVAIVEELFGDLIAVELDKGRERWRVHTDGGLVPLIAAGGLVVEAGHGGMLRAFDTRTGRERWKKRGVPNPELELAGRQLIAHTSDGWLISLDLFTGREHWKVETRAEFDTGHPEIGFGKVFAFGRKGPEDKGTIWAVDLRRGKLAWSVEAPEDEGELGAGDTTIDFYSSGGDGYFYDPKRGTIRGRREGVEKPAMRLSRSLDLYVDAQSLRAVERRSGDLEWKFRARFFDPASTIATRGTPPFTCPLGLEPTSAVRIRDWAAQRLDLGTTVVSANGYAAYVAHAAERTGALVFKIDGAGAPTVAEAPIAGDIWGAAAAEDGHMAVATQLPSGELAVSVVGAEPALTWTATIAAVKKKPSEPRVAWSNARVVAVWTETPAENEVQLRAVVLDPSRRVVLGAMTVAEQKSLDFGSRIVPGEYDVAFDGEAFGIAYARIGPGVAVTVTLARISDFGVKLGEKRIDTLELDEPGEGLIDLAATPKGLGIVYAGKFAVLYRNGGFQAGPVALPRHPRIMDRPTDLKIAWNGSLFGIAWGLSSDDSEAYVTVADLQGRMAAAVPLGRGGGAQQFELAGTPNGFFAVHIPDEAGGRKPRAAVGTWLGCRTE